MAVDLGARAVERLAAVAVDGQRQALQGVAHVVEVRRPRQVRRDVRQEDEEAGEQHANRREDSAQERAVLQKQESPGLVHGSLTRCEE